MNILFISGYMDPVDQAKVVEQCRGPVDIAANTFSGHLIKGLEVWNQVPIKLIGDKFVPVYPTNPQKYYLRTKWSHSPKSEDIHIGFLNSNQILRHISKSFNLAKEVKTWALNTHKQKSAIVVYSVHSPYLKAAVEAKKVNPDIHVSLVVPDLPRFMDSNLNQKPIKKMLKYLDGITINHLMKQVDSFVFLSKAMKDYIKVGTRPWRIVEGIVDNNERDISLQQKAEGNIILYTGTIDIRYGILDLLKSFSMITGEDYKLWICGDGDGAEEVRKFAINDSRIKWFGQIPRDKVLELQRAASLLVNPRLPEKFTIYSFPSKTMEYMLSGTPVVMRRLPAMPDEYLSHLFIDDGNTPESLAETIRETINLGKGNLFSAGQKAQAFIMEEKNYIVQAGKLWRMLTD